MDNRRTLTTINDVSEEMVDRAVDHLLYTGTLGGGLRLDVRRTLEAALVLTPHRCEPVEDD